jgi:uncharacterized protein
MKKEKKIRIIKVSLIVSALLIAADIIYRNVNNIDYLTREKCILYQVLPRPLFLFMEHYIELGLFMFLGIFLAMLLENNFSKYKKFYPKTPFLAFVYASILPICSCTALPLLKTLKEKINLRTLITFVMAAPLLSPPIILLSFSVLGVKYAILRILAAGVLAISLGYIIEFFYNKDKDSIEPILAQNCQKCKLVETNVYIKTLNLFKSLLPFLLIAGTLGLLAELFVNEEIIANIPNVNSFLGIMAVSVVGIPIYLCNGADVLILRPFVHTMGLELGTAVTFSLTSTAICVTSTVMFLKFLGRKLTIVLLISIFFLSAILGYLINFIS